MWFIFVVIVMVIVFVIFACDCYRWNKKETNFVGKRVEVPIFKETHNCKCCKGKDEKL